MKNCMVCTSLFCGCMHIYPYNCVFDLFDRVTGGHGHSHGHSHTHGDEPCTGHGAKVEEAD